MTPSALWPWILLAGLVAFATKLSGYLIPAEKLQHPRFLRVAACLTVGLLASLTTINTVASGETLHPDARLVALLAALVALLLRAPYIVVVVVGAAACALARLAGLP